MKNIKNIVLSLVVFVIMIVASSYTNSTSVFEQNEAVSVLENKQNQTINLFVTHGHCSTPFAGIVDDLILNVPTRDDLGNPLEEMSISYEIDPNSLTCVQEMT